jgi:hypothetical protein
MTIQDYLIDTTRRSAEALFKCARAVPADKLEWAPLDIGRSTLDILRECAKCPDWGVEVISGDGPEWSEELAATLKAEQSAWLSVEDCERECNARLDRLFDFYRNIGDERLSETKFLPYDGGRDFTMVEMMEYPHWNFDYHLGQISYIQTLYGDKEMH